MKTTEIETVGMRGSDGGHGMGMGKQGGVKGRARNPRSARQEEEMVSSTTLDNRHSRVGKGPTGGAAHRARAAELNAAQPLSTGRRAGGVLQKATGSGLEAVGRWVKPPNRRVWQMVTR